MESEAKPEQLPVQASQCRTLKEWREWKLGMSQDEVAKAAGKKQSRISEVERGEVMPRKKLWPDLLRGFQLQGQEAEFFRMIRTAQQDRKAEEALRTSRAETPLLDPAQNPSHAANDKTGEILIGVEEQMRRARA